MSEKEFQVGDEIEAMCGTCKAATVHNIEVIKEGAPTKVLCKSCNNSHKFRKPPEEGEQVKPSRKKVAKTKVEPKSKEQRKWTRVMRKVEGTDPVPYNMGENFEEQNVIDHSKFGVGVVSDVIDPTKISVVFEHGEKVLVHNRG